MTGRDKAQVSMGNVFSAKLVGQEPSARCYEYFMNTNAKDNF